jgi:hypothetical protein
MAVTMGVNASGYVKSGDEMSHDEWLGRVNDRPAFEIIGSGVAEGLHIKIYANGKVEGFEGPFTVVNRISQQS